ncbi:dihydrolipoamide acetyltransferase family protein [Sphingobacterium sp.]|uniref:dihydrolipoamide acetyltransferase family protein n=1 Tax=Sphingobacterium sp. TaxID=341027 RepID=UPI0028ACC539|nr:dihydrolipoamide acetyltransferase family protein [Sphingobacterium sp.]
MALYKLLLPKMGESVSEATITKWLKQPGDLIDEDDTLLEIATDKVDSEVPSPVKGILKEQRYTVDQTVQVGEVVAIIEIEGQDEEPVILQEENTVPVVTAPAELIDLTIPGVDQLPNTAAETASSPYENALRFYSPLVKNIARHEGLSQDELDRIQGTGAEGRVTKEDILAYVAHRNSSSMSQKSVQADQASTGTEAPKITPATSSHVHTVANGSDEIIEMDRMRRLIADHMVKSVQTSPHVCSFVEADVTNLVLWRNKVKDAYKKREGENITFTPLFIEAISKALKDFPLVNISIDGYNIIKKKNINIGMAAALPNGNLIVPVIKNADQLSLVGLSKSVNDLAQRSRANKLKPDDTQDGTFTFTNIGAFGNIMGTPIINQPQAAILAVGTITKKPAVIETEYGDMIGIRHMMYLSLSYDHRAIDGALGGTFLKRVADYLENWDSNRVI